MKRAQLPMHDATIPNLPHASVALGKDAADNPEIRVHGAKADFGFKPLSHVELCEKLKLVDFARGAKLSGSGFLLYAFASGIGVPFDPTVTTAAVAEATGIGGVGPHV